MSVIYIILGKKREKENGRERNITNQYLCTKVYIYCIYDQKIILC